MALAAATAAAAQAPRSAPPAGLCPRRRVAIGDPQADLGRFFAILDRHGLLGPDGRLAADVQLVSLGDHFDWGGPDEREAVARSGLALLAWLASHPADQAVLLLGNHDLARVGELAHFTDEAFLQAQADADEAYGLGEPIEPLEQAFLGQHPELASAEVIARDFSSFRTVQARWVGHLLRARRFRAAWAAADDLLVLHAGVTRADLQAVSSPARLDRATPIAEALNAALDAAVDHWTSGPFEIAALHVPGSRGRGAGRGIFYHRPSLRPEDAHSTRATPRRRFDPRQLPPDLVQVIGHTRDRKARELLGLPLAAARDGVLRHLVTDGREVRYAHGPPPPLAAGEAALVFTDGGMREARLEEYQLFDLDSRAALGADS